MNYTNDLFRKALEDVLKEHRLSYQHEADNIYSIRFKNKPDRITTAKLIASEPILEKLHGSKNNTETKAIGYFRFKLSPEGNDPNFYIFAFSNNPDKKVEFVIVPCNELKNRITSRKCNTDKDQETELKLWLLPPYIFETTHFGGEGEWYFIAGRMAENTIWDYTLFLNGWDRLITCT